MRPGFGPIGRASGVRTELRRLGTGALGRVVNGNVGIDVDACIDPIEWIGCILPD